MSSTSKKSTGFGRKVAKSTNSTGFGKKAKSTESTDFKTGGRVSKKGGFLSGGKVVDKLKRTQRNNECSLDNKDTTCVDDTVAKKIGAKIGAKSTSKEAIIKEAKKVTDCDTEACVVETVLPNAEALRILRERFRPEGPSDSTELLNNFNIDNFGQQLMKRHTDHIHLKFAMIDFNTQGHPLNQFNMATEMSRGKKTMSCVLNTDVSSGGGKHWFCVFVDTRSSPIQIEYFNTDGRQPDPSVQEWLLRQEKRVTDVGKQAKIVIACDRQIQQDDNSCGVWCLCYIWARLEGVSSSWFCNGNTSDKDMFEMRSLIFRSG